MAFLRQCLQELRSRQQGEHNLAGLGLAAKTAPPGVGLARHVHQHGPMAPGRRASAPTGLRCRILHADPPRTNPDLA